LRCWSVKSGRTAISMSFLGKPVRVRGHAELFEPVPNLLQGGHQGSIVAQFWTTATKSVH
jgi:hypothetical protein